MALAPLAGMIGGPLLSGMGVGASIGLTASQLGAGIAGLTSLIQGNDPLTAGLDALGGYGGASGLSKLSQFGASQAASTAPTVTTALNTPSGIQNVAGNLASGTDAALGTTTTFTGPVSGAAATSPFSFSNVGTGLSNLMETGGAEAFKNVTGSSALGAVGVPAAGLALQAMPTGAATTYEEPSYGFAPFVPISERRRENMGYAGGGLADLNPMAGAFDARNTPQEYGEVIKNFVKGGVTHMENGGFVVPADVVSHLGNGSSDAGLKVLMSKLGARPIKGKGDGMDDKIPATIEGKQPARVANDEAYVPKAMVAKIGDGDVKRGARRLYAMMDKIRKARTGNAEQGREINPNKFVPA